MVAVGWRRRAAALKLVPVALLVAATVLASSPALPAFAGAASPKAAAAPPRPSLAALRAEVERTGERLASATLAWERGQQELGVLVQRKLASRRTAEQLQVDADAAQVRVASLAGTLYRNPVDPMITAVLTGDPRALADVMMVRRALRQTSVDWHQDAALLGDRIARTRSLLADEDAASAAAIRLQARLEDQLTRLQQDAQASLLRVEAMVTMINRQQAAAKAARAGACSGPLTGQVVNGFLPSEALCALQTAPGHRLIAPAAAAFDAMSTAFRARFGTPLCVTDSYRDYATQVKVFRTKPNLAATPGRSQHGWGRAVDLCGGVQKFGTAPFAWLKQNSTQFGFAHPDWAEPGGSRPEPWHWEFQA